ncbi:hypothetical protein E4N72_07670 [Treponema vincentii]|uniref:hypothetical protein n=1 Tax=Treponema vincentii TaxID=69710 RepID=UPI0020A595DA|nr:hypothetical protein [Treponema vincentii]UTC46449.1 hypothetical protein E4N72_07670 [Treponema vincentii]
MKKLRLISVSILFAALCLAFTACNQGLTAGKGTGEVRIVIDNGATRAVNAEGMPQFDESNTKITVTGEDGNQLAEGTTSVTLTLDIGKEISIKVVVKTATGEWHGSAEHTVTAGTNTIAVKLSKTPKSVGNILSYVVKNDLYDSEITLKLVGKLPDEKLLVENSGIGGNYLDRPVIARDSIGRIYMLYDKGGSRNLTRFDAEGNPHCEIDLNALQNPSSPSIRITTMTVDAKTNTIFVFDANSKNIYALTESESKTFIHSNPFDLNSLADVAPADTVTAAAAYNGALFLAASGNHTNKLIACDVTLSGTSLTLDEKTVETLDKLRPASSGVTGGSADTECTGLFADESGVYCLLREQKSDASQLYMVGALIQYTYSDGALTKKQAIGLHSKAGGSDPSLAFDANAFVNPVCFIGYDEDYLYIADDGAEINENAYMGGFYTAGNKNRIAAVKRDTTALSFDDSTADVTWFKEYAGYRYAAKIPHLLWTTNKGTRAVTLNLKTADGTVKELVSNIRNQKTARDSTGAVYILYHKDSKLLLERFAADGTRDKSFGTAKSGFDLNDLDAAITDIAVDFKTGDVFLLKRKNNISDPKITAYMAKKTDGGYTNFSAAAEVTVPKDPSSPAHIDSVAAFDGTLFVAMDVQDLTNQKKLYAYKMETASKDSFAFTGASADAELRALRPVAALATLDKRTCTGLFADGQGVYALLTQQDPYSGISPYALGQVVRFSYDGSTLTEDTSVPNSGGLNPAASGTGALVYNPAYLSNPAGFIGYDGDTLYFADDGVNIEYKNENYRINGNKDRIMAFNRKDKTVSDPSIGIDGASWSAIYNEYREPNTKMLLWENGKSPVVGMKYWLSDDGSTASPDNADALWASTSSSENPTDQFCYDQDGNLYILWKDNSNNYKVRRFELKDNGSYKPGVDSGTIGSGPRTPRCIAVDISDGQNCLYYGNWDGSWQINKVSWTSDFTSLSGYGEITVRNRTEDITALAVNKDGIFVDVKEDASVGTAKKYRLKVQKYAKTGSPTAPDSEITLVDDAPRYTKATGEAIDDLSPIASAHKPYIECEGAINGLQVVDGVLYAITSRITQTMKYQGGEYKANTFSSGSSLYKVGTTSASFSGAAEKVLERPADGRAKIGYGFYRFIAVKPKKLVIASDSAWDENGIDSSLTDDKPAHNTDTVVVYDLGLLNEKYNTAGGSFSKQLKQLPNGCGFGWN